MQFDELKQEYQDGSRLGRRVNLHDLFSRNRQGWYTWVFDQFEFPFHCHLLELGCGPGILWQRNSTRIPEGWQITVSDFSTGMLEETQTNLATIKPFNFAAVEAQAIPLADNSLDGVIANHMLYHVPDRGKAYAEIQRVLKPGGQLYAATNGRFTMRQYDELINQFSPGRLSKPISSEAELPQDYFCLENGCIELAQWFSPVLEKRYDDALLVTAAEPLVVYAESSGHLSGQALINFRQHVEQMIGLQGALQIDKIAGILIATKAAA